MQRSIGLLRLARFVSTCNTLDVTPAAADRLLSHSQASTSAAYSQVRNARFAREGERQRQSNPRSSSAFEAGQRGSQNLRDDAMGSPDDVANRIEALAVEEAEEGSQLGFVPDGQFPYAASDVELVHTAGSTETGWEFLGASEEDCITWFGVDFTRGQCPEVERNALLSDSTKEMMYQMHSHDKNRYVQHVSSTSLTRCSFFCCELRNPHCSNHKQLM